MPYRPAPRGPLTAALLAAACLLTAQAAPPPPAMLPAREQQSYAGLVQPKRQVTLNSPLDQRIATLDVEEGDRVEAGQLLAKMDDRVQQAIVEAARIEAANTAPLRFAELSLQDAELRLTRLEQAHQAAAATDLEVQTARIARDQAVVRIDAEREQLRLAEARHTLEQERLDQYRVAAPFNGIVARLRTEAGASLTQEEPILDLVALDPLEAQIHLPAEVYGRLRVGERYELVAGPPVNRTLTATLDRIDPLIDPGSRTFRSVFQIENDDWSLPAGFVVHLDQDALSAPAE